MLPGLALTTRGLAGGPAWLVTAGGVIVGGGTYGLVTWLLGSEEPVALMRSIRQRTGI
jgi:hypothetical protein